MRGLVLLGGCCLLLVYLLLPDSITYRGIFGGIGVFFLLAATYNKNDKGLF